jgi:hypothetical protein
VSAKIIVRMQVEILPPPRILLRRHSEGIKSRVIKYFHGNAFLTDCFHGLDKSFSG